MPRPCSICSHSQRTTVDFRLAAGSPSIRSLAKDFDVSPSALRRHKQLHIPEALARAHGNQALLHAGTLADHVRELYSRSGAILQKAEASGDARTALGALRELRSIIDLVARLAEKDSTRVHVSTVRRLVEGVFDLIHEFVPPEQWAAATARLEGLARSYADDENADGAPPEGPGQPACRSMDSPVTAMGSRRRR
jgi:hypothetical protein